MVCSQFGMKQKRTQIPKHYLARLLKNYPRPLCAPSFIKSGTPRILQTIIFIFSYFFLSIPYIYTRGEFCDASSGFGLWAKTLRGQLSMCFHFLSLYFYLFLFYFFFLLVILNLWNPGKLTQSESGIELTVLKPCGCSSLTQAFSVNAFRCRIRGELAGNSFARTTCPETHWSRRIVRPRG